ncbi:MAG: hypothetical protein MZV63_46395 [Marinilabiliales bacterium]|nr:hypothetical protein [Marinilabiliales bacterium]
MIDILALMGDTADNIPGAPGVGPKTADEADFGIWYLLKNCLRIPISLKESLKRLLRTTGNRLSFQKSLQQSNMNVPVELNEKDLETETPDPEKLKALFDELEFRTIAARILAEIDKPEKPRECSAV